MTKENILKNLVGISAVSIDEILANPGPRGIVVFDNDEGKYLKLDPHFNVVKELALVRIRKENPAREVRCVGNEIYYLASKSIYSRVECIFSPEKSIDAKDQVTGFSADESGNPVLAGKKGLYNYGKMLFPAEDAQEMGIEQIIGPICRQGRIFALVEYMNLKMGIIEILENESPRDLLLYDFDFPPSPVNAEIMNSGNTAAMDGTFYPFSFVSCASRNSVLINNSEISGSEEPAYISNVRAGFRKGRNADIFFESAGKILLLRADLISNGAVSKQIIYERKSGVSPLKFDLVMDGELEKRIVSFSSGQE
jgi:hypothetical protein